MIRNTFLTFGLLLSFNNALAADKQSAIKAGVAPKPRIIPGPYKFKNNSSTQTSPAIIRGFKPAPNPRSWHASE